VSLAPFAFCYLDKSSLPVRINNDQNCRVADCPVDLGPNCPSALKGPFDSTGFPVGCKSACLIDSNPTNSAACCSGSHNTPATCPTSGVPYYRCAVACCASAFSMLMRPHSYFKTNCPNAYAYAYDESSESALFTCASSKKANYQVTFCP
jgi:hypothetical protein